MLFTRIIYVFGPMPMFFLGFNLNSDSHPEVTMYRFVAHSDSATAVRQVRRHRRTVLMTWVLEVITLLAIIAFMVQFGFPDGKTQTWMYFLLLGLTAVALYSLRHLSSVPSRLEIYLRPKGKALRVRRWVFRDYKSEVREIGSHWSDDMLFDRQQRYNELRAELKGNHEECVELGRARQHSKTNTQAPAWD